MAVEYNVVILGDSPVARYAAEYARSLNARVALVTDGSEQSSKPYPTGIYTDTIAIQSLRHIGQALPTYIQGPHQAGSLLFPDGPSPTSQQRLNINGSHLWSLVQTLLVDQREGRSLSYLEQLGVDVVYSDDLEHDDDQQQQPIPAEFYQNGTIGLKTSRRCLPSQAYLIAMDGKPIIPAIPGIESVEYTTLDTFFSTEPKLPASSVLIVSDNQQGVETASALGSLGIPITLVMTCESLVADPDAHQWMRQSLESMGIGVHWGTSVVRLEHRTGQCVAHLNPPNGAVSDQNDIMADRLLFIMGRRVDLTALRLGTVGVAYDSHGVAVNAHYRTSQARLFACGDAIQSPPALNQRYAEVAIAIHHALFDQSLWSNAGLSHLLLRGLRQWFRPALPPAPTTLPNIINIGPPLAYIGYSETEAQQRYDKFLLEGRSSRLTILYQSYQPLDHAQLLSTYHSHHRTGWCKLLVLDDGQIVGAYVWGIHAEEVMGAIALAMHHSIPMEELGHLCSPMPSITAEVLQALGLQWRRERIKRQSLLFDWLELVFNWQRDWTR